MLINRIHQNDCTVGMLNIEGFRCFTLELPWRNNQQNISCIPAGTYWAFKRISPSNGAVLQLEGVPNRTFIQIHKGNYTSQIAGCILVGDSLRDINGDGIPDVTNSTSTLHKLLERLPDRFQLEIR